MLASTVINYYKSRCRITAISMLAECHILTENGSCSLTSAVVSSQSSKTIVWRGNDIFNFYIHLYSNLS